MADSVANLLLRFASESDPAKRDVSELIAVLKTLEDTDAAASGTVKVDDGGLSEMLAALKAFGKQEETATANVETRGALSRVRELNKAFKDLLNDAQHPTDVNLGDVEKEVDRLQEKLGKLQIANAQALRTKDKGKAQRAKVLADLEKTRVLLEDLNKTDPRLKLNLETNKVKAQIDLLKRTISTLRGDDEVAVVPEDSLLKIADASARVDQLTARLDKLRKATPKVHVDTDLAKATADLKILQRQLRDLKKDKTVKVEKDPLKIADQMASVKKLQARLKDLQKVDPKISVNANIERAQAQLALLQRDLEKANKPQKTAEGNLLPKDPLKVNKILADIKVIKSRIETLSAIDPKITVTADIEKTNAQLDLAKRKLAELKKGTKSGAPKDPLKIAQTEARIDQLKVKIKDLKAVDPTVKFKADTKKLETEIALAEKKVKDLLKVAGTEAKSKDILKLAKSNADLELLRNKLNEFEARDPEVELQLKIDDALAKFGVLQATLRSIDSVDLEVDAKTAAAQAEMLQLAATIALLEAQRPTVDIDVQAAEASARIATLEAELAGLHDEDVLVSLKRDRISAELAILRSELALLDEKRIEVEVDVDKTGRAEQALTGLFRKFGQFASAIGVGDQAVQRASSGISRLGVNLGGFSARLSPAVGLILALVAAIGGSLVAALATVASAAAFAAAAIGALATSMAAAAGPAITVLVAAFTRLSAVWKAVTAQEKADQANTKKTAEGMRAAAQAAEERRQAGLRVADALRNIGTAERGVQQAEENAADAIVSANQNMESAARSLADANRQVAEETVNAYEDMEKAVRDVEKAILDLEGAELGIEDASIETRQAVLDLKELRSELGAVGTGMESAFEKFTNVDYDFKDLKSALADIGGGGGTANLTEQQSIDLEKAILRVRKAKLGEKEASNQQEEAELTLADARKKNIEYQERGIAAYEPLTAAIRSQQDASIQLANATREANKLNAEGVAGAPAVIAAYEALATARRNYTEALRQKKIIAAKTVTTPQEDEAKRQMGELNDPEKRLAQTISKAKEQLKGFFTPASTYMIMAIDRAVKQIPTVLGPLKKPFTNIGKAFGSSLDAAMGVLADPKNSDALYTIVDGAAQLVAILGQQVFKDFLQIFIDIASASMPQLLSTVQGLADGMARFAEKTSDAEGLSGFLTTAFNALNSFKNLVWAVAKLLVSFFTTSVGEGTNLVDMFTGLVNKVTEFLSSANGKSELKQFFADVIPLAVAFGRVLGQAFVFFFQAVQVIAPALSGILNVLADFIGIINIVVHALIPFLQIAFGIAAFFFGFFFKAIKAGIIILGVLASVFPKVFSAAGDVIKTFVGLVGTVFNGLLDGLLWPFKQLINFIDSLGGAILEGLNEGLKGLVGFFVGIFNDAVNAVKKFLGIASPSTLFMEIGTFIVQGIKNGLKTLLNIILWPFRKALELLDGLKDRFVRGATRIVGWVKEGLVGLGKIILAPFNWALDKIEGLKDTFLETGGKILGWIADGLKSAPKAIWDGFKSALGKLGDLLPGSEPKDKSSPLTGLKKRGSSIFGNIAEGFDLGSRNMTVAMHQALSPVIPEVTASLPNPARLQSLSPASADHSTHIEKQEVILPEQAPGTGYDPKIAAIDMAREMRRRR